MILICSFIVNFHKYAITTESYINVSWYGILFSIGILLSSSIFYHILFPSLTLYLGSKKMVSNIIDSIFLWSVIAIIVGARIGYILFYNFSFYIDHPIEILKIWMGGLASHGAIVGLVIVFYIFSKINNLPFFLLCDAGAISCGLFSFLVRGGNFINQEIIGTPTNLPWGALFMDYPFAHLGVAVHPVQLYEGIAYMFLFLILFFIYKTKPLKLGSGLFSGLCLISVGIIRFLFEFVKEAQGDPLFNLSLIKTGQLLSIPMILSGVLCLYIRNRRVKK